MLGLLMLLALEFVGSDTEETNAFVFLFFAACEAVYFQRLG